MPCTLAEFHTYKGNTRLALYTYLWLPALYSQTSVWNTQGFLFPRSSSSLRPRGWRSLRRRCTGRPSTPSSTRPSFSRTSLTPTPLTRRWCLPSLTMTDFQSTIELGRWAFMQNDSCRLVPSSSIQNLTKSWIQIAEKNPPDIYTLDEKGKFLSHVKIIFDFSGRRNLD